MHLNKIARELRITTQELRDELAKTNFGVNPNTHEVDDGLGMGIVRFLKDKVKPTRGERKVAVVFKSGSQMDIQQKEKQKIEEEERKIEEKEEKERIKIEKEEELLRREDEKIEKMKGGKVLKEQIRAERNDRLSEDKKSDDIKKTKTEIDAEERDKRRKGIILEKSALAPVKRSERSQVPRASGYKKSGKDESVQVSRRIELKKDGEKKTTTTETISKNYYKKKRKKGRRAEEEKTAETMQRHPGRKIKIAKVSYDVDTGDRSAEEIAIEKEIDREAFRSQKKNRAISQRRGYKEQTQIKTKTGTIEIPSIISLKEFSEKCGIPVAQVISTLFKNGVMATINQQLDFDTAEIVAVECGMNIKKIESDAKSEDLFSGDVKKLLEDEDKSKLQTRPPVISIMGHVDHGKTKLLDYIREANVVDTEAGGITQHIGAYQVEKNGKEITFLDTPGHEAFTSMRARGAKATDIAILVVAADEGVKPQTIEAINHANEAGIPIIVAINKIDKPNANPDKVKGELAEHGLQSEDWGGKTIMAPVSSITGEGIDNLLEMILLTAEMEDLKANPDRMAVGTIIESHLDKSLGPVATILVNSGTLKIGDNVVIGTMVGKIKTMHDHTGKSLKIAPPSFAVRIAGLEEVPQSGDLLQAFKTARIAKKKSEEIRELRSEESEKMGGSMAERIVSQISSGQIKLLKIVLKADTKGSLEAVMQALHKIKTHDVAVKVIHFGVGNISGTDVVMAAASEAFLFGFHVEATPQVHKMADKEGLVIKDYRIIYKMIEDVKATLSGMLEPEINVIELGKIEIKEIFLSKKTWVIAGGKVIDGKVQSGAMLRLKRGESILFETELESLKYIKEDVREPEKGSECGFKIKTPKPVEPGDILEIFKIEKIERTLD